MKNKIDKIIITFAFCAFLAVMFVLYFVLPKNEFSVLEKRFLASSPEITKESILSGEFGNEIETYLADHMPARDFFVGLNSYFELFTGRQAADDIYVTKNGSLVEAPCEWSQADVDKSINAINTFAQNNDVSIDMMVVPSAGWASRNDIFGASKVYNDESYIEKIYGMLDSNIDTIDVRELFDDPELYYNTDHHWTSKGAYLAYKSYMESINTEYREESDFEIEPVADFYGSTYSRAALWLTKPENLEFWHGSENITVTNGESDKSNSGVFYRDRLKETDKYTVFLDGNHSIVRINNPDALNKETLLVVRDSYTNCLGGFLSESYENVILVDLRYYKKPVSELCVEENVDRVLVCYSLSNFLSDKNIIWLR
ncbi:MAG: hypothetical protein IJA52_08460 [Clostridia bacterium]|nr:hypothetical protein [Clostridia bacterium]